MLAKDTKIIMKNKVQTPIQDIVKGDWVKTKYNDEIVTKTSKHVKEAYKFIFSDGFKVIVGEGCSFVSPNEELISITKLKEGDYVAKPDNNYVTIVDITPLGKMEVFDITTENAYYLVNGMCVHNER
jgi:hypothetical protein